MTELLRIAGVQLDIALGDPDQNLEAICSHIEGASKEGARLVIFPECAATGYCFDSLDEARPLSTSVPGPYTQRVAEVCRNCNVFAVFGLLEQDGAGLFNAAALVGPQGLVANYRKIHLPHLGVDRFVTRGDRPFAVHNTDIGRIGLNICYDSAFPESSRIMALAGADLIVLPTNFPTGAEDMPTSVVPTRALENRVHYACVNRIGTERGFRFIGQSRICDADGQVLAEASATEEAVLIADIDLGQAREKRIVRVPGKHIIDRIRDRRPEMYGQLAATKQPAHDSDSSP